MIFKKVPNHSVGEKNTVYSIWCWGNGISICRKKMKLDPYFTSYTKINS